MQQCSDFCPLTQKCCVAAGFRGSTTFSGPTTQIHFIFGPIRQSSCCLHPSGHYSPFICPLTSCSSSWEIPQLLPDQLGGIIPPSRPASTFRPPPGWLDTITLHYQEGSFCTEFIPHHSQSTGTSSHGHRVGFPQQETHLWGCYLSFSHYGRTTPGTSMETARNQYQFLCSGTEPAAGLIVVLVLIEATVTSSSPAEGAKDSPDFRRIQRMLEVADLVLSDPPASRVPCFQIVQPGLWNHRVLPRPAAFICVRRGIPVDQQFWSP
ncbi:hypothetical protein AMECASPLE_001219 [Ameca splendens]|uniref:Uncharacterized protein n=1 Tax=Ameca splendens TaxID=208324 RepID=A0ABV1A490_9TELE